MTKDEALALALNALHTKGEHHPRVYEAITALETALAQPVQEPVEVDQATMELAESVGLIGPTSRTHDLHQAIQRFHDLICVNATVKAAQMAVDVIRESTPPKRPWQGLEAEDLAQIESDEFWQIRNHMAIALAVEAKLKEKNR